MIPFPVELLTGDHTPENWHRAFEFFKPRTASGHLGVELVEVGPEHMVLEVELDDRHRQPLGFLHGGVSALLAETASSFHAVYGTRPTEVFPMGVELNISHLGSARAGRIRVRAEVLKRGRTTITHDVRITHVDTGKLLSVARVTNLYRKVGG